MSTPIGKCAECGEAIPEGVQLLTWPGSATGTGFYCAEVCREAAEVRAALDPTHKLKAFVDESRKGPFQKFTIIDDDESTP